MSTSASALASSLGGGKLSELKNRILFVIGALLVFRLGSFIPVPGINPEALSVLFDQQRNSILGMFNMFSGGALERLSVFALGIMPYISASIIIQLMTKVIPTLEQISKEGEAGRRKITQYTRLSTLVLATFQSLGVAIALESQSAGGSTVVVDPGFIFRITTVVSLVTGTLFLMWLGEQITERGIGNGISLIIFAGIVAGLPSSLGSLGELVSEGSMSSGLLLILIVIIFAVTAFVVFVERGQRRITVNYASRQQGNKMYAAQTSHLPLKVNMAGVIPPIFASSIILFPATIGDLVSSSPGFEWMQDIASAISPGQPLYILFYALGIFFFCFFYTALMFNPKETADNLKRSGAYIPGIRPGEKTSRFIDAIMSRLTLIGAVYITGVCLLPEFLILNWDIPFYFGGTSLLIIVVVTMDFMAQIQTFIMSHQYEGLMKKANLRKNPKSNRGKK
ncbi:MAG: preprotein translocase subunit SecY [Gammaproteobacteria bacterium]|nr:preprotein translocase subunit SecY [Gammaproteobacteria bacterium]